MTLTTNLPLPSSGHTHTHTHTHTHAHTAHCEIEIFYLFWLFLFYWSQRWTWHEAWRSCLAIIENDPKSIFELGGKTSYCLYNRHINNVTYLICDLEVKRSIKYFLIWHLNLCVCVFLLKQWLKRFILNLHMNSCLQSLLNWCDWYKGDVWLNT